MIFPDSLWVFEAPALGRSAEPRRTSFHGRDASPTSRIAPPGKYRVTVAVSLTKEIEPGVLEPEPEGGWKSPIPAKYANPATTDILVEVTEGGSNDFQIVLK
jgi:hypothetical protein